MRRVSFGRPSPAMVVACVALFAAIGGGAYAAARIDTEDIRGEAVTGPKIAKRAIKSSRLADDNIKGKKLRDNTVEGSKIDEDTLGTVPEARNSDTVDGKHANCDPGTQLFAGDCWETAARASASWPSAAQTCATAGGYLPHAGALRAAALAGFTLAGTDEHTADINTVTAADAYTVVTVSQAGVINLTNQTDPKGFRCVFPLVH